MADRSSVSSLLLLAFLASVKKRSFPKRSGQILMLTGGLLLLTVIFAWVFQEQIGKSYLNIVIVAFIMFVLVARLVGAAIYMRSKSGQARIIS